jgi:hypothetical protein
VISVKMAKTNEIKVSKCCSGFAKAQKAAAAGVDHYASFAVDPNQVSRGCTPIIRYWAARPQYLNGNAVFGRAGRR